MLRSNLPALAHGRLVLFLALAVIVGSCCLAYENSVRDAFIYDDTDSIVHNDTLNTLWPPWKAMFPVRTDLTVSGRPMLGLSLAANYAISGLDPWSYHEVNILIHTGAALLLFGIIRRTLGIEKVRRLMFGGSSFWETTGFTAQAKGADPGSARRPTPSVGKDEASETDTVLLISLGATLVWALHPLQTESVTYVVQRAESMAGMFYLATFYCFIRSIEGTGVRTYVVSGPAGRSLNVPAADSRGYAGGGPGAGRRTGRVSEGVGNGLWGWAAIVLCLLGVCTKETVATAPILVLLYDRTFVAGTFAKAIRRRWRIHAGLFSTWVLLAGLVASTGWNRSGTVGFGVGVPPWAYWLTQFEALTRYLCLAVWPSGIVFNFGAFWVTHFSQVAGYACLILPLMGLTLWALRRQPMLGFVGAWFFVILAPTSLMPGTTEMVVEHRMYLPLAAVAVVAALWFWQWVGRDGLWLMCGIAVFLGFLTHRRNVDFSSNLSIWTDTVAKRPDNAGAHFGLGNALLDAGRTEEATEQLEDAVRLDPNNPATRHNLGTILVELKRYPEAIEQYKAELILRDPDAFTLSNYGKALLAVGQSVAAIAKFDAATKLDPDDASLRMNYAQALVRCNRLDEALVQCEKAIELEPADPEHRLVYAKFLLRADRWEEAAQQLKVASRDPVQTARAQTILGTAYLRQGRLDEAINHFRAALWTGVADAEADGNLAEALIRKGRLAEAVEPLRMWLHIDQDSLAAHGNLGAILTRLGRYAEAETEFREVIRISPQNARAHDDLGNVLLKQGQIDEALAEFEAALAIDPKYVEARTDLERAGHAREQTGGDKSGGGGQ